MGRSVKAGPTHIDKDGTRTYCGITRGRVIKSLRSARGHISVISRDDAAHPGSFGFILCPKCKELAGPGIRGGGDIGNVIARTMGGKKRRASGRVVYEGGFTKLKTDKTVHIMVPGDTKKMYCGRTWDEFVARVKREGVQTRAIGRDYALKLFDIVGYDAATSKLWPRQKLCPECKKAFKEREADVLGALASAVNKLLK